MGRNKNVKKIGTYRSGDIFFDTGCYIFVVDEYIKGLLFYSDTPWTFAGIQFCDPMDSLKRFYEWEALPSSVIPPDNFLTEGKFFLYKEGPEHFCAFKESLPRDLLKGFKKGSIQLFVYPEPNYLDIISGFLLYDGDARVM